MKKLSKRQITFALEYAKDNDTVRAAFVAGYSARRGEKLLEDTQIGSIIAKEKERTLLLRMATPEEILEFYTSLMRGNVADDVIVKEKDESGQSINCIMQKTAPSTVRLSAAKQLGVRFGLNMREGCTDNPMEGFFQRMNEPDDEDEDDLLEEDEY